ncbi:MAG: hypothetical protein KKA67_10360 [Spirochaetes bacterium]|nr:hypothetical protein [Spirochaetota bacterium]MBU1078882.1 hypothetical protein [Spirochaetota bacterium]
MLKSGGVARRLFVGETALSWLLEDDDPSLAYRVGRDLLGTADAGLAGVRAAIGRRGWARGLLDRRGEDGHWGRGAYGPKWTCTHYVLYELAQLGLPSDVAACRESAALLLGYPTGIDGGVNYARTVPYSDVCVNGMLLGVSSRFGLAAGGASVPTVRAVADFLLERRMSDGGWNCAYYQGGVKSSLHTTISVLEGLWAFDDASGGYRRDDIRRAIADGVEFILRHRLYRSERTGETIKDEFFKFPFPVRWKYDVLRCLDLFRERGLPYDGRMSGALDAVVAARDPSGRWRSASQAGATYFVVEPSGEPGRWNTLRALRVLARYRPEEALHR